MRNYLSNLNTVEIIHLRARINGKKASLTWQNLPVPPVGSFDSFVFIDGTSI